MSEMNRKDFLKVFAATVAVAAVLPVLDAVAIDTRLPIGSEFFIGDWVHADSAESAWRETAENRGREFRRAEQWYGVRFGDYTYKTTYDSERNAWFVQTDASIVGYA